MFSRDSARLWSIQRVGRGTSAFDRWSARQFVDQRATLSHQRDTVYIQRVLSSIQRAYKPARCVITFHRNLLSFVTSYSAFDLKLGCFLAAIP